MENVIVLHTLQFYKDQGYLVLSDQFIKYWTSKPFASEYQLGLHRVSATDFNKLRVTFQDDRKLQCALFALVDPDEDYRVSDDLIKEQLQALTGFKVLIRTNLRAWGLPLTYDRPRWQEPDYVEEFQPYMHLRDFKVGSRIATVTFQNGPPQNLDPDVETLMISDSSFTDLEFLLELPNLRSLVLERTIILDPLALGSLLKLTHLHLETIELPDSGIIADLSELEYLALIDCDLKEIHGLAGKSHLTFCELNFNPILFITELYDCPALKWVVSKHLNIYRVNARFWNKLNILEAGGNFLFDLCGLERCPGLKILDYTDSQLNEEALIEISYLEETGGLIAFNDHADLCDFEEDLLEEGLYSLE